VNVSATSDKGAVRQFRATARIDTPEELIAFKNGGILPYVLRQLVRKPA
jgi:aconitate hydratase